MFVESLPAIDIINFPIQFIGHVEGPMLGNGGVSICLRLFPGRTWSQAKILRQSEKVGNGVSPGTYERASRHRERSKHHISCIPYHERKRNQEPNDSEVRRCMRPAAFASTARSRRFRRGRGGRSGRSKVWFRELLGVTASRDHFVSVVFFSNNERDEIE